MVQVTDRQRSVGSCRQAHKVVTTFCADSGLVTLTIHRPYSAGFFPVFGVGPGCGSARFAADLVAVNGLLTEDLNRRPRQACRGPGSRQAERQMAAHEPATTN